ncbi:MAG: hypothetical protein VX642_15665 [Bdellovibrionota bacterium]|nr:hypothetical protein [Bdellovibrionota bacterium]
MIKKSIGFIIVILLLVVGSVFLLNGTNNLESFSLNMSSMQMNTSSKTLYNKWKEDLENLKKNNQLPGGFDSIKEVHYTPLSSMAGQWVSGIIIPITVKQVGKYRLNLEIDSWTEKNKTAAVVHYQMVEIRSGNTVWEFGRTYPIR